MPFLGGEKGMKINDKEVNLKITPMAIRKVEEMDESFDVLKIIREAEEGKEPRLSDYYKVIYTGYIGATNESIAYDEFLKLVEDVDILTINSAGVDLLTKRKN